MRRAPFVLLLAGLALFAGPRWSSAQDPVLVHVPFPFVVHGALLPAGDYSVVRPFGEDTLIIQDSAAKTGVVAIYEQDGTTTPGARPALRFLTVGGRHYLWQISEDGMVLDVLPPSDARLAKAVKDVDTRVTN